MNQTSRSIPSSIYFYKLSILIISAFFLFLVLPLHAEMLSVKGEKVNMRSGPGKKYPVVWEYGTGVPLKVLAKKGKWVNVQDFEKDTGWIYRSLLTTKPQMIVKLKSRGKINIRSGPGTQFKKVGEAYYGVVFDTVSRKADWVKVEHESGLVGWVKRNLLWGF